MDIDFRSTGDDDLEPRSTRGGVGQSPQDPWTTRTAEDSYGLDMNPVPAHSRNYLCRDCWYGVQTSQKRELSQFTLSQVVGFSSIATTRKHPCCPTL